MILSGQTIRRLCHQAGMIEPFVERGVIRGRSFGLSAASYDFRIDQSLTLPPQGFSLASTIERWKFPAHVVGLVKDKSSWARLGLTVQNTLADPGFEGFLTLELTNHSDVFLEITAGDPIGQMVFCLTDETVERPYGSGGGSNKYQNQGRGPQAARFEEVEP